MSSIMRIAQHAEDSNLLRMEEESTPLASVPVDLDVHPQETLVADPLSSVTRNERRSLLVLSVIGIAIVKTGLVPSKIEALGIEFSPGDQKSLLNILGMVNLYLLVAFSIYALADFIGWRARLERQVGKYGRWWRDMRRERKDYAASGRTDWQEAEHFANRIYRAKFDLTLIAKAASPWRAIVEFVVPILVGISAIWVLWTAPPPLERPRISRPIVLPFNHIDLETDQIIRLMP